MAAEQHANEVEIEQLAAQPVLSIRDTIQVAQLGEVQDDRFRALSDFLQQRGIQPAGPFFVRYHTFGETETDMETGIPVAEPVAGEGRIAAGELPGGPAISTWHIGAHEQLGEAYARIEAGLKEHNREPAGPAWEVYYWVEPGRYSGPAAFPEPSSWRTQLVQPVR